MTRRQSLVDSQPAGRTATPLIKFARDGVAATFALGLGRPLAIEAVQRRADAAHVRRRRVWIVVRRFWRVRRRQLAVAAVVLAVLAGMAFAATDPFKHSTGAPSRAQVCASAHRAAGKIPKQLVKTACSVNPTYVPVAEPVAVEATPGCHVLDPADRRRRLPPRTVSAPREHVPFFAARSGKLPASGTPVIGGIKLPRGSRCGPFWSTDAGVPDAFALSRKLASVFPSTGLWPVVWTWPGEEPDHYVYGGGNPARADSLSADTLLRRSWQTDSSAGPFPGLAHAELDPGAATVDPFDKTIEESLTEPPPPGGWMVLLVPANRPADAISVLHMQTTEWFSDYAVTAVLRSWEERFGAVLCAMSPGGVELAVAAPPRDEEQARRLAAEQAAFAPEDDGTDDLDALARQLRSNRIIRGLTSARYWAFGWPD
jgi:hypothetical protein